MSDIHIICARTETFNTHSWLDQFLASLERWGWPEPVWVGRETPPGMVVNRKLRLVRDEIVNGKRKGKLVVLDCLDLLVCRPWEEFVPDVLGEDRLVIGGERNLYPDRTHQARFENVGEKYWMPYANGGFWYGDIDYFLKLYEKRSLGGTCIDQQRWNELFALHREVVIDDRAERVLNLIQVVKDEVMWEGDGRVTYIPFGTQPFAIHANGDKSNGVWHGYLNTFYGSGQ